jgi:serine/threonine protein kinase
VALTTGTRLGPYEIVGALGAGGMGEVYRARDTRLKRDVALKSLSGALAVDADRLSRFRREAEVLASLNHPNIAHLYGLEDGPAGPFLVMELVEGEDLSKRVSHGALPFSEALALAKQIAEALEAAHEKGIIHRDLKPSNVMVTPDGVVKVLDFGLAKAVDPTSSNVAPGYSPGDDRSPEGLRHLPSQSPTLTATVAGMILGTAAYMSPEQAKGRVVDKRADIWAFGCVVYEMLTGRRAFDGDDVADTLAFVLTKDASWTALPPDVPQGVRRLLARCLEKDPKKRLRDIGEARIAIDESASGTATSVSAQASQTLTRMPWGWVAAVFALAVPAAWFLKPTLIQPQPLLELEISPPVGAKFANLSDGSSPIGPESFSPDGRHLVFKASSADGKQRLWLRTLEAGAALAIPESEGGTGPFWSPDSRSLAFFAGGKLLKMSVPAGRPQFICNANGVSGTWNAENVILFWQRDQPILRVSAGGGTPSIAIGYDEARGEYSQAGPQFLPDGRHFIYSSTGRERGFLGFASLDGKTRKYAFLTLNSPPHFALDPAGGGWIFFIVRNRLFARPFDPATGDLTGEAVALADPVASGPTWAASQNGYLAFQRNSGVVKQLTWVNRDGKALGSIAEAGAVRGPRLSPQGNAVVFDRTELTEPPDVYVFDLTDNRETRFTLEPGPDASPVWTPDGQAILYHSQRDSEAMIVERPFGRLGDETTLFREPGNNLMYPGGLGGDGHLVVAYRGNGPGSRMFVLSRPGGRVLSQLQRDVTQLQHAEISPDGRWLLYSAVLGSRRDVFAERLTADGQAPRGSDRRQISTSGGMQPAWRRDGKEIFYLSADAQMLAVPVESGADVFHIGTPRTLFQTQVTTTTAAVRDYDVTADGQKFLLAQTVSDVAQRPITVIVNWPKLLQR